MMIRRVAHRNAVQGAVEPQRRDEAGGEIRRVLDRRLLQERVQRLEQAEVPRHGAPVEQIGDVDRFGRGGLAQQPSWMALTSPSVTQDVHAGLLAPSLGGVAARPGGGRRLMHPVAERR